MKEVIRRGLFETNSSSVHSITMCDDDTYKKWENGELLYDSWNEKFISKNEIDKKYEEYVYDYEGYWDHYGYDYETFDEIYETKNDIIHAFGYYGHD